MEITALAQLWIGSFLREGDLVIDATAGNGHDTGFLARRVGAEGRVFAFDIQDAALAATRRSLGHEDLLDRVTLVRRSHSEMRRALLEAEEGRRPTAIMFNLGYLPGGDKSITTLVEETMRATAEALNLLAPGGGMTVVLYPGHREGEAEVAEVLEWAKGLSDPYEATVCRLLNRGDRAPLLVAVEKRT